MMMMMMCYFFFRRQQSPVSVFCAIGTCVCVPTVQKLKLLLLVRTYCNHTYCTVV